MVKSSNKTIKLKYRNKIYAYVNHSEIFNDKYNFITNKNDPLQLGFFEMNSQDTSKYHYHNDYQRISKKTSEFIYVLSGKIEISFYSIKKKLLNKSILFKGGSALIFDLGHEIKYLKKTKLIEVKTGPFNQNDKSHS